MSRNNLVAIFIVIVYVLSQKLSQRFKGSLVKDSGYQYLYEPTWYGRWRVS